MNNQELKSYAKKNNLTNRALSKILICEEVQISRWFNNKHKISRAWQALIDSKLEEMDAKIAVRDAVKTVKNKS